MSPVLATAGASQSDLEMTLALHPTGRERNPVSATGGRVRLRTLILIRWVAIAGQALALMIIHFGFGFEVPLLWAFAAVAASVAVNILATLRRRTVKRLRDQEAAAYLAFDLLQLGVLLFLTGGPHNPFAVLVLAPVIVSATVLSRISTIGLMALALAVVLAISFFHLPLPWSDEFVAYTPLYSIGVAIALALAVVFLAVYVFSVAEEARRMSAALAASHLALDRAQRVSALGALAAAAAHRLGSPLGTIAVVAKELVRELPPESPHLGDARLLLSESERCRAILTELSTRPESGEPLQRLPLAALVETAAAPYRTPRVRLTIDSAPEDGHAGASQPQVAPRPELLHGLGNLLQNAIEFARAQVTVRIRWSDRRIHLAIRDDGPGIAPGLLDRLGEPYLSSGRDGRVGEGEPMGLGVFIAQTLLGRTGADVTFANIPGGGAEVTIGWNRVALDSAPSGGME